MARIRHDFVYDPAATNISTPLEEVLAMRRGVCQDFAHCKSLVSARWACRPATSADI